MALWICDGCGCAYSVGAARCPHCGDTRYTPDYEQLEDGAPVATVTSEDGPQPTGLPDAPSVPAPALAETPAAATTDKATT